MEEIFQTAVLNDELSVERCRELLGDEGVDLCDDDIDRIRHCADTTLPVFNYLNGLSTEKKDLVDQTGASWNRLVHWLRQLDALHALA